MKTTDFLFHPDIEYIFQRQDTGDFVVFVRDSAWNWKDRKGFYRLIIDQARENCTQSVYEEKNGILCPVDERTLIKTDPARPFTAADETARQKYQGDAKYAPLEIKDGDRWHYVSEGRWTWQPMPAGEIVGSGIWHYDVTGFLLFNRLTISEIWTETVDGTAEEHKFDRLEVFDMYRFLGFDDAYATGWDGLVINKVIYGV